VTGHRETDLMAIGLRDNTTEEIDLKASITGHRVIDHRGNTIEETGHRVSTTEETGHRETDLKVSTTDHRASITDHRVTGRKVNTGSRTWIFQNRIPLLLRNSLTH
jgi:hypothetical protein